MPAPHFEAANNPLMMILTHPVAAAAQHVSVIIDRVCVCLVSKVALIKARLSRHPCIPHTHACMHAS
jgi:hypothetical protein